MPAKETVIHYEDIGDVTFRRSDAARNYRIQVNKNANVIVVIPKLGSLQYAEKFVEMKKSWILKHVVHIQKLKEKVAEAPQIPLKQLIEDAYNYIPARITELSKLHNLPFRSLKLNTTRKRWGSCSRVNDINISVFTMLLPKHLVDFILLHELTHVIHKNHQAEFHAKLNELCNGKEKQYSAELRNFERNNPL